MKKSFAVDRRSIYFFLGFILIGFMLWLLSPLSVGGWILAVVAVLINAGAYAITPQFCIADEKGMTVYYMFLFNDRYEWTDIKRIYSTVESSYGVRSWHFSVYEIESGKQEKKPFFMDSKFSKTIRMKRIIKEYWDGEVEWDEFENFKKKLRAKKEKNDSYVPDESEATTQERCARAKVREITESFKTETEKHGQFIKVVYTYDVGSRSAKSRPKESYSYMADIEIGKIGSSEDERLYIVAELLFVRYGKRSIKVMLKDNVYEEIRENIAKASEQINQGKTKQ